MPFILLVTPPRCWIETSHLDHLDLLAKLGEQLLRDPSGFAIADVAAADRNDWRHFAGGSRDERFVDTLEVGRRQARLTAGDCQFRRELEHEFARDAGQKTRRQRRRQQTAVADDEE